jgi:poly-beta-hydroxyalkanoate depolymerase
LHHLGCFIVSLLLWELEDASYIGKTSQVHNLCSHVKKYSARKHLSQSKVQDCSLIKVTFLVTLKATLLLTKISVMLFKDQCIRLQIS